MKVKDFTVSYDTFADVLYIFQKENPLKQLKPMRTKIIL